MAKYIKDFFPVHREQGAYSGNARDLAAEFNDYVEPDPDNPEAWLTEERLEDDFKKHLEEKWALNWRGIDFSKRKYYICGQSHIDVAWLWRYWQTCRKAIVTFKKAVWHAKHHPTYAFAASEPVLLEWIRHENPKLFEDIKEQVKAGRFDVVGGMWVEPDCHLPSGEAFCRQRLHGQRFYLEHFGRVSLVEWVPDSFGFASTLPQILAKSGSPYFHTTKLCGNSYSQFPFVNFLWESPDGSHVLANLSPGGFGAMGRHDKFDPVRRLLEPGKALRADYSVDKPEAADVYSDEIPPIGMFVGKGDGGHGPTGEEVAVLDHLVAEGKAEWMNVTDYFSKVLERSRGRLPVWADELYYEYHRGTLTTHALVKRMNRYFEWRLCAVEKFAAAVAVMRGVDTSRWSGQLRVAWKLLALNQFHDVLPGSSIPEAYDDVYDFWEYQKALVDDVEGEAWAALLGGQAKASGAAAGAIVFNASGHDVADVPVEVPFGGVASPKAAIVDGETVPVQLVEADSLGLDPLFVKRPRRLLFKVSAPQHAFRRVAFSDDTPPGGPPDSKAEDEGDDVVVENGFHVVRVSKRTGDITSIVDKKLGREVLASPGIQLHLYFDWHPSEQAWNISPGYRQMPIDVPPPSRVSIIEAGPVRWTVEVDRDVQNEDSESGENGKSRVLQRISLVRGSPGVHVEFLLDWHTCECTAKVDCHMASVGEHVVSEVPYGTIKRLANPKANHDVPRWEQYHQTWLDVPSEDGGWGVAFINTGRYGHDTKGNRIGLTLVRGPLYPKPSGESWVHKERADRYKATGELPPAHADLMCHLFNYVIVPHEGHFDRSEPFVPAIAHWCNEGCVACIVPAGILPDVDGKQVAWIEGQNAEIGAIKDAEDRDGRVVRVVEAAGTGGAVTLRLHASMKVTDVVEADILERPLPSQSAATDKDASGHVTCVTFAAKPHEIKTLLLKSG
ncbi:MAG: alpha-mannosidase [Candidatus Lokiarchaeota archaeon]|nr:alpha-mannosidase [Candidatus Lokiarchaeota archaeon]